MISTALVLFSGSPPTRVGTLLTLGLGLVVRAVHPHASGDANAVLIRARAGAGSPSREWGR